MNTNERHGIHDSTTLQTAVCTRAFNLSTGSNPVNWFLMRSLNIRCQIWTRWGSYLGIDIIRNQFVSFVHWSMLTNQTNPQLSLRIHGGYTMLRQKGHIWPVTQQDEIPKQRHLTSFNIYIWPFSRTMMLCDAWIEVQQRQIHNCLFARSLSPFFCSMWR